MSETGDVEGRSPAGQSEGRKAEVPEVSDGGGPGGRGGGPAQ